MPENSSPVPIPVALLSQALIELRSASGNRQAERDAAIRYIQSGIANGYQLGPLIEWLFFWPNDRESVFWQARLDARFVDMLKNMRLDELGLSVDGAAPAKET